MRDNQKKPLEIARQRLDAMHRRRQLEARRFEPRPESASIRQL
jgi:hypothetical protein